MEQGDLENIKVCPKCGGKIVEIRYGYPTEKLFNAAVRGEVILGGCCVVRNENGNLIDPQYGCVDCGERF